MKRLFLSFSCLSLLAFATYANADTIGPSNCPSCLGSSYTLTYVSTANPDVYDIYLNVNTSQTTLPGDFLNAVAVKIVSKSSDITSATLVSGPSTFSTTVLGGLSAGGCSMGPDGFICSQSSSTTGVPVGTGDIYNFEWVVTEAALGNIDFSTLGSSVKALYVDSSGKQNGITSEPITLQPGTPTPVPEPSTLLLLGTGAMSLAGLLKRGRRIA